MLFTAVSVLSHWVYLSCVSSNPLTNGNSGPLESIVRRNKSNYYIVSFQVMGITPLQDTSGHRYAEIAGEWASSASLGKHKASESSNGCISRFCAQLLSPIPSTTDCICPFKWFFTLSLNSPQDRDWERSSHMHLQAEYPIAVDK